MEKEMIEHLRWLKYKGFYNIEFHDDSIKSVRRIHVGQINERIQNIDITPLENSSRTLLYHGTTLENAKKIIKDGFLQGMQNKEEINYNKTFMTNELLRARKFSQEGTNYDGIIMTIDITKYQVYTFVTELNTPDRKEWVIWGKVDIKDVKFNYFKHNVCIGELSSNEIMSLPKVQPPRIDIFSRAKNLTNKYLFDVDPFGIHGIYHSKRVILILQQLVRFELLPDPQKTILAYAGLYHDIGRLNNGREQNHGFNSYKKIIEYDLLGGVNLNTEEFEIMKYIIEQHCIDDEAGHKAIKGYNIENVEVAKLLYEMFKDADNLDRVSLGDFDKKYLRRNYSQLIEEYARSLYELDVAGRAMIKH